jgi:ammonium transporter, Amt family
LKRLKAGLVAMVTGLSVLLMPMAAWATNDPTGVTKSPFPLGDGEQLVDRVLHNEVGLNLLWIVLGSAMVIFMQAGFALVETGFTRAKHAVHVVMTNFAIFGLGMIGFFTVGFALMFGSVTVPAIGFTEPLGAMVGLGEGWGLFGTSGFFLTGGAYDVSILGFFLFQVAFMDTTATIPTGSMAERWKFSSFVWWGLFCGAIFYPLYGAWVWGGGWLSQLGSTMGLGHGAVDFAGSGVVHAMGGMAALAGAIVLGPRIGKFDANGKPRAIPGHDMPMAILGTLILLFGWFGFNAASTFAASDLRFTVVAANTALAAGFGATTAMVVMWRKFGKPDPSMSANGMLAGLVAITAPCAFVQPWAAALIGTIAGVVVVYAVLIVEHRFKIDDPVGAVAVHGVNGIWGLLALGLFADGSYGEGWNGIAGGVTGLFYGDAGQLIAQLVSIATVIVFGFGLSYLFFSIQHRVQGIRSKESDEIGGLDLPEMGTLAYPDFLEAQGPVFMTTDDPSLESAASLRAEVGR